MFVPTTPPTFTDHNHLSREAGEVGSRSEPGEGQAQPQPSSRIARVLGLLCGLITHGKRLAYTLRQSARTPAFPFLARAFGTTDLVTILVCIARGLRLAAALYARLEQRAAAGRDLTPPKLRMLSPRGPATPRPNARRVRPQPAPDDVTLPTPEQIAALLRRPLGVVLTDICRDLGINPGDLEPGLWRELTFAIIEYGGSLSRYVIETNRRSFAAVLRADAPRSPAACSNRPAQAIETPQPSPPELAGACPQAGLQPDPRGPPLGLPVAA
jgi:hypothetical protein